MNDQDLIEALESFLDDVINFESINDICIRNINNTITILALGKEPDRGDSMLTLYRYPQGTCDETTYENSDDAYNDYLKFCKK